MSSTSAVVAKKYDVFISFRGEDTRSGFTSHLHAALCRNKIETYIDYRIEKGQEVWVELEKAIKDSTLFLVILSENYASSTWCLNELLEIMECMKNEEEDVDVIPVFYKIEPSRVRKQTGCYKTAFTKHKQINEEKMQKWKDVLYQLANLSGFHSHGYRTESDLIEDIITAVLQRINHKFTNELRGPFILDENYSHIESLLKIDSREVQIIGIWGMGGIGKTTLAGAIFHNFSSKYEGSCFLENVAEESKRHGLNYIYNRLICGLLRKDLQIDTPKLISSAVMRQLLCKKVFIVLDDVNTSELLVNLVGDWLGPGSKVILTTRDKHVLISGGVDKIHEVKEMNFQNSLKLFSLNAFKKTYPEKEYEELSKKAVVYTKGVPLALKVLGSYLRFKSESEWDSALTKLKKIPNAEIQKVLRLSYDGLDDEEKNIFLDIACFFKGQERERVTKILNACGFFADIGIRNLLDKALITDTYDCITIHDLIQEMGREIVREESIKNPGQRSRLWNPEEIYNVLANNSGTTAVEGIQLDMTQIKDVNLSCKAFKKMSSLRLLAFESHNGDFIGINSVHLPNGLVSSPKNLIYFKWDGYPLKSLSSTFCPEKLVELSMPYSKVQKLWNRVQNLPNLEMIDLSESQLEECPNFSGAPNLKYVMLNECKSLSQVDPSIFSLPKLESLDVAGCTSLKSLCSNTCSPSLRELYASRCYNLKEFSITLLPGDSSTKYLYLCLAGWDFNEHSSSLMHIRNLGNFTFHISDGFSGNFAYQVTFTDSKKHESDTLITLHKVLDSSSFQYVRHLIFMDCHNLFEFPNSISLLSSLEYLSIRNGDIISLPENIRYLPQLKFLEVLGCKRLQSIPDIPQSIECFHVRSCESLKVMLSSMSEPSRRSKCTFSFPNCINLDQHSYDNILKYAIVGIELGANEEDTSSDNDDDVNLFMDETVKSGKFCYFFPSRSSIVQDWFHYHSTQALVTVDLPSNFLGVVFYLVLSQDQSCYFGSHGSFGCECSLETGRGEMINITSFFVDEIALLHPDHLFEMKSDHVFIWYDAQCCKQIMEAIKERNVNNDKNTISGNPKVTFKLFAQILHDDEIVIKKCGFRWIYPFKDQIVEERGRSKCKRSREIYKLEVIGIQNKIGGFEPDEQEETVPPTKKLKQNIFGTPSNTPEAEAEDLRHLFEELLNIKFGGELTQ